MTVSRPTGTIIAPPTPCMTRDSTSSCRLVAHTHSSEPTVNSTMALKNTFFTPKRSASQPLAGNITATVRT
ncbi:hypothetical protein SGGMMB4_04046 [Sodalis glossinidius str. 'morsitans']|uniref:Uncharacterized protein n=1 Tax=Sodalis glossinidius (strain morsitans) TaxID=343509 RepID=A0A193QLD7_SODGM|nr:hypothetical protein SGGMMB4_04046 [Sodalis glossinidius str. 'morsitans']